MEQKTAQLPTSDKLWVWFDNENNRKRALVGAAIVAIVGLVGGFYMYNQGQKEIAAGQALSKAMMTPMMSGNTATPEAYLKVATDHPGSPAASQAVLLAAGRYYAEGKFADAQAQFQRFTRDFSGNPFTPDALMGVAASLEAQGKTEEAAQAFQSAGDRFPNSTIAPQAKFSLARIQESQGKIESARGIYEQIRQAYPMLTVANEADYRLEQLNRKSPKPVIAPPVFSTPPEPSPTPTPTPQPPVNFQPSRTNLSDQPKS